MGKTIREAYGDALLKYGRDNENVVVLDADVSASTKSAIFRGGLPDRFFNCGICENAMAGMAAGLAAGGKIPFVNGFAVFLSTIGALTARTYMSYSGLNIKLCGGYGGFSAGYDGSTHHTFEDLAVMRALPGITVLVASDAELTDWLVKTAIDTYAPMYIRLSREEAPPCHASARAPFQLGKGSVLREGKDATVFACGIQASEALKAAGTLAAEGIQITVVDMFTIKPLDTDLVLKLARETGAVITAEEHSVIGGLGAAVAETLVSNGIGVPLGDIGVNDSHADRGKYLDLLAKFGLDAPAIAAKVRETVNKK